MNALGIYRQDLGSAQSIDVWMSHKYGDDGGHREPFNMTISCVVALLFNVHLTRAAVDLRP